jgi:hypothetical protein
MLPRSSPKTMPKMLPPSRCRTRSVSTYVHHRQRHAYHSCAPFSATSPNIMPQAHPKTPQTGGDALPVAVLDQVLLPIRRLASMRSHPPIQTAVDALEWSC